MSFSARRHPDFRNLAEPGDEVTIYYSSKEEYSVHYYAEFGLPSSGTLTGKVVDVEIDTIDLSLDESYQPRFTVQVISSELDDVV